MNIAYWGLGVVKAGAVAVGVLGGDAYTPEQVASVRYEFSSTEYNNSLKKIDYEGHVLKGYYCRRCCKKSGSPCYHGPDVRRNLVLKSSELSHKGLLGAEGRLSEIIGDLDKLREMLNVENSTLHLRDPELMPADEQVGGLIDLGKARLYRKVIRSLDAPEFNEESCKGSLADYTIKVVEGASRFLRKRLQRVEKRLVPGRKKLALRAWRKAAKEAKEKQSRAESLAQDHFELSSKRRSFGAMRAYAEEEKNKRREKEELEAIARLAMEQAALDVKVERLRERNTEANARRKIAKWYESRRPILVDEPEVGEKLSPAVSAVVERQVAVDSPVSAFVPSPVLSVSADFTDTDSDGDAIRKLDFGSKLRDSDDIGRNRLITLGVGLAFVVASILTHSR